MSRKYPLLLPLLAACLTLSLGNPRTDAKPPQLRILSYNIHHGSSADGEIDLDRLAKIIVDARPDLVALQEVDRKTERSDGVDQAARLAKLTGMHAVFGKAMEFDGGQYGEAILTRVAPEQHIVHPLPVTRHHEPRAALAAQVALAGLPELWLVATHLDHTSDETERLAQTTKLFELFPHDRPMPIIVAGDLNATPDSEVMRRFRQHWRTAAGTSPAPTCPAVNPRVKIDYVLLRQRDPWRVTEVSVLAEPEASDHRPLLVVLEWTGAIP